jgi:hypothetical protein
MEIEVHVRLIDLKSAFRRLIARLPDESEAGAEFIVFSADADRLNIVSGGTSETLRLASNIRARRGSRVPFFVASLERYGSIAKR